MSRNPTISDPLFKRRVDVSPLSYWFGVPDGTVLNRLALQREALYAVCRVFEGDSSIERSSLGVADEEV